MKSIIMFIVFLLCMNLYAQQDLRSELNNLKNEVSKLKEDKSHGHSDHHESIDGTEKADISVPELAIVSDLFALSKLSGEHGNNGFYVRHLDFHFLSNVNSTTAAYVVVGVDEADGAELGEVYIDFSNIQNVSIKVGKFLQSIGKLNTLHISGLDQFDNPLVYTTLFGDRINQYGLSFHWMFGSSDRLSNNLFFELTNTDNETLFNSATNNPAPSFLLKYSSKYIFSDNSYVDFGVTALAGKNNVYQSEDDRWTKLFGLDFSHLHICKSSKVLDSLFFRSEFLLESKEVLDSLVKRQITAYGMYAYLQAEINPEYTIGLRYDYSVPLELSNSARYTNQITPYITYLQGPNVKMRLQYNYSKSVKAQRADQQIVAQLVISMGAHKHHDH